MSRALADKDGDGEEDDDEEVEAPVEHLFSFNLFRSLRIRYAVNTLTMEMLMADRYGFMFSPAACNAQILLQMSWSLDFFDDACMIGVVVVVVVVVVVFEPPPAPLPPAIEMGAVPLNSLSLSPPLPLLLF